MSRWKGRDAVVLNLICWRLSGDSITELTMPEVRDELYSRDFSVGEIGTMFYAHPHYCIVRTIKNKI